MAKGKNTIKDIAKKLGVSAATVSRALNGDPRISEKTVARVKQAAKQVGYRHNRMAAGLRNGRSRMIGVIIPTANRNFFGNVLRGIEQVANENEFAVLITQSNDDENQERNNINLLLQAKVDGIILSVSRTTRSFEHFESVREAEIPLIQFDRVYDHIEGSKVVINDYAIARRATAHLIEQGYSAIGHFGGPDHINIFKERYRGYRDALADHGIPFRDEWVVRSRNLRMEEGRAHMQLLFDRAVPVDAILSASDFAAVGAMKLCMERGMKIPEEMGFVGFANEPFTQLIEPRLTTVDQRPELMGRTAAKILFEELADQSTTTKTKVEVEAQLIIRNSSLKSNKSVQHAF